VTCIFQPTHHFTLTVTVENRNHVDAEFLTDSDINHM